MLSVHRHAASALARRFASVTSVAKTTDSKGLDVSFGNGGTVYRFHAMWLRDACRSAAFVKPVAEERNLRALSYHADPDITIARAVVLETGLTRVEWSDDSPHSHFESMMLQSYAKSAGRLVSGSAQEVGDVLPAWLSPYTGFHDAKGDTVNPVELQYGRAKQEDSFPRFTHESLKASRETELKMMQAIIRYGAIMITGVPAATDAGVLKDVAQHFGGLQKDPARPDANWQISYVKKPISISYDPAQRLNNHTDQSVAPHGCPGLLLCVHYVQGEGFNSVVDGFAVAQALKERDPEAFSLLATHGFDAQRNFTASRADSVQEHADGDLTIQTKQPIFQLDAEGNLVRVQFHEVFRHPLTVGYDVFPAYFRALCLFYDMIHSDEFELTVPVRAGSIFVFHNWRTLHGRVGSQSPDRLLVGGTVTKENFCSRARATHLLVNGAQS